MCGLRQGEALALRWCDIDLEGSTLRIDFNTEDFTAANPPLFVPEILNFL